MNVNDIHTGVCLLVLLVTLSMLGVSFYKEVVKK